MNRVDVAKFLAYRNVLSAYANGEPIEVMSEVGRWYESDHIPTTFSSIRVKEAKIAPIDHREATLMMIDKVPMFRDNQQYLITSVNPRNVLVQQQYVGFAPPKEEYKTFEELTREFTFENGNPVGVW